MSDIISYFQGGEVLTRLVNAGMTPKIAQEIVEARGNKKAKAMVAALQIVDEPKVVLAPVQKFEVFKSLGVLTVPGDYNHAARLASFYKKHQDNKNPSFYYYNSDINDENFSNPSRILKPGDNFRVDLVRQIVPNTTTSEERVAFLESPSQGGIFLGAQGASLVFGDEKMRANLPKGNWCASFDKKDRLWRDAGRYHRVPYIHAHSGGGFEFRLGHFGYGWRDHRDFFLFRDSAE